MEGLEVNAKIGNNVVDPLFKPLFPLLQVLPWESPRTGSKPYFLLPWQHKDFYVDVNFTSMM